MPVLLEHRLGLAFSKRQTRASSSGRFSNARSFFAMDGAGDEVLGNLQIVNGPGPKKSKA
jgi:hypothetical protein